MSANATVATARRCPICDGEPRGLAFPYRTIWNGKTYSYRRCGGCGGTFVDPVPGDDELEAIYAWDNYHARHYAEVDHARYAPSLDILARHAPGKESLLDFGCGNGGFLLAAAAAGYRCEGVEYEAKAIAKAQENAGVPVSSLEALLASGRRFDVVHMTDVLPHLPDPAAVLERLEDLLAPDGLFFIEGPLENNASPVYYAAVAAKSLGRVLGRDAPAAIAPTMLVRLDRDAQRAFFNRRMGYREHYFEVFETGWPYYVPGRRLGSPGGLLKQAIGALAIAVSRLERTPLRRFGNRFRALYGPEVKA